jgi:hypothetical protein
MVWVTAGAAIGGSIISSRAGSKAAKAQGQAGAEAQGINQENYQQIRNDLKPYTSAGGKASDRLSFLLGIGNQYSKDNMPAGAESLSAFESRYDQPEDRGWTSTERGNIDNAYDDYLNGFGSPEGGAPGYGSLMEKYTGQDLYDDPSYQFRLDEGLKARENSAAARGMQLSGANLKGLDRYSQDYASQEFGAARNRYVADQDQTVNYLTESANRGLNAAGTLVGAGNNNAQAQSGLAEGLGNVRAANSINTGNALTSGINSVYNAYQDNQSYNRRQGLPRGRTSNQYSSYNTRPH